jgi:hypothetical protein
MIKLLTKNLVADATLTGSATTIFPLSNLKDYRRTKTTDATTVVFDFGSAKVMDTFAMADAVSRKFTASEIRFQANATDDWTTPTVNVVATVDALNGLALAEFPQVNLRYARVIVTGQSWTGKTFIGKAFELPVDFTYPLTYRVESLSTKAVNLAGQIFVDESNRRKLFTGQLPTMTADEYEPIIEEINVVLDTMPLWVIFDDLQGLDDQFKLSGYYLLAEPPESSLVAGNFWTLSLSFTEAL